jgi:hypothetical protein
MMHYMPYQERGARVVCFLLKNAFLVLTTMMVNPPNPEVITSAPSTAVGHSSQPGQQPKMMMFFLQPEAVIRFAFCPLTLAQVFARNCPIQLYSLFCNLLCAI